MKIIFWFGVTLLVFGVIGIIIGRIKQKTERGLTLANDTPIEAVRGLTFTNEIGFKSANAGDITFIVGGGKEIVKLKANGDIYIHGKKVENDIEVVNGFKEFLRIAKIEEGVSK